MKRILTIAVALLMVASVWAQSPEKMSYQAVIRDGSDALLIGETVQMQISILQGSVGGSSVYTEVHNPTTNANGLVSLEIGTGSTSDIFSDIDWSNGTYFIKTETDPTNGSNYTITGTTQLMSVPYAFHAKTASGLNLNNNVATSGLDDFDEYQVLLYKGGTATTSYGLGIRAGSMVFNSNLNYDFDVNGNTVFKINDSGAPTINQAYTLPSTDGASNQVLTTDGSGQVSWGEKDISGIATNANDITSNAALIAALEARIQAFEPATVGDFRAGGVVFWVDPTDSTHGLVCAVEDQSTGIQWGNGSNISVTTGTAIGTGKVNTAAIISAQGGTETDYAAGLARAYSGAGYSDWFLPSQDELNEMYLNRFAVNVTTIANGGDSFATTIPYWSSTEWSSSLIALDQYFSSGAQENYPYKSSLGSVRAVRAF